MKRNLKFALVLIVLSLFALCFSVGCGGTDTGKKISLDKTAIEIQIGEEYTLGVIVTGAEYADVIQTEWSSSAPSVATVTQGKVKGVSVGTATVTAKVGNATATCKVTVTEKREVSISLDKTELVMQTGDSPEIIVATVENEPKDEDVEWLSSNVGVVTVFGGRVTVVGQGTATVTASISGKTATCDVTVLEFSPRLILSESAISLREKDVARITAEVKSHDRTITGVTYSWVSSDGDTAIADSGTVTAKREGTATVTVLATTADGRVDVSAEIAVTVTVRTVTFGVNRMIPATSGFVKDGETETITCKEGDSYIFEKIWSYKGLLIDTYATGNGIAENGFTVAEDGSTVLDVYYTPALSVAGAENVFLAHTVSGTAAPCGIGGTAYSFESIAEEVGGKTGAIKLTNTTGSRQEIRFVGADRNYYLNNGPDRLSFEIYSEDFGEVNVIFGIEGYSLASSHNVANMNSVSSVVCLYDQSGARVYKTQNGNWYRVDIILEETVTAEKFGFPALGAYLICEGGKSFYIRDVKAYAPEYKNYTVEYYLENELGGYTLDEEYSYSKRGIVGETVFVNAEEIDEYIFDANNAENVLTLNLTADGGSALKLFYKKVRYSDYAVKYYTQNPDGTYTETEDGYVVFAVREGNRAVAKVLNYAGYALNTYKSETVIEGEVLPDNGLTLSLYYDIAIPVANTDGKATLFTFTTGTSMTSGRGQEIRNVGEYQGKTDVYKFTQTERRSYTAIVGIDDRYIAESEYKFVKFDMFVPSYVNIVLTLNYEGRDDDRIFSMDRESEVRSYSGGGIFFFDTEEKTAIPSLQFGKWVTVYINLENMAGGNSRFVERLYMQMGTEAGTDVYFCGMTLCNRETAEYSVEYYFETEPNVFVKDPAKTQKGYSDVGYSVSVTPQTFDGYSFDAQNVNNVIRGPVASDGSLTLKLYYSQIFYAEYTVEYYLQDGDGNYIKDESKTETLTAVAGSSVNAESKEIDGYIYSMRNTLQVLSATATDGAVLKVYYDKGMDIKDGNGNTVGIFANELSIADNGAAVLKNAGASVTVGETVVENGGEDIYVYTVGVSGQIKLIPFGITRRQALDAGYKKLSFKLYVTADFVKDRIYQIIKYTGDSFKEYRINSGNLNNNDSIMVFDENGTRIYDFASDYQGWITIEYNLYKGDTFIDGYGVADTVNDTSVINYGLYCFFYTTTSGNVSNKDKPLYISQVVLSTEEMGGYTAA